MVRVINLLSDNAGFITTTVGVVAQTSVLHLLAASEGHSLNYNLAILA